MREQDARDGLGGVDEGVLNRPRRQLRPGTEAPGAEALVVLGVTSFPDDPVLAV